MVKNPSANAGDSRDGGSIPGSGRSSGVGNGNPLQHSCLGNLHREEADGLHGVAESDMTEQVYTYMNLLMYFHFFCTSL